MSVQQSNELIFPSSTFQIVADSQIFSPGSFSVETEKFVVIVGHLKLSGTERLTVLGTGILRVT